MKKTTILWCAVVPLLTAQSLSAHAGPACVGGYQVTTFNLKVKAGSTQTVSRTKIKRPDGTTFFDKQKTITSGTSDSFNALIDNSNTTGSYEGYTVEFETSDGKWSSGKSLTKNVNDGNDGNDVNVCGKYTVNGTIYSPSASKSDCDQSATTGC